MNYCFIERKGPFIPRRPRSPHDDDKRRKPHHFGGVRQGPSEGYFVNGCFRKYDQV